MDRLSKDQIACIERVLAMYRRKYSRYSRIMAASVIADLRRLRDGKPI